MYPSHLKHNCTHSYEAIEHEGACRWQGWWGMKEKRIKSQAQYSHWAKQTLPFFCPNLTAPPTE